MNKENFNVPDSVTLHIGRSKASSNEGINGEVPYKVRSDFQQWLRKPLKPISTAQQQEWR